MQLWDERMYRGNTSVQTASDVLIEAQLARELDALMYEERAYAPPAAPATAPSAPAAAAAAATLTAASAGFGFREEEEASLGLESRARSCAALETDLGLPMDARRNALFIIGTQKGGTTFLFNALKKHAAFVGADHAYGCAADGALLVLHGCPHCAPLPCAELRKQPMQHISCHDLSPECRSPRTRLARMRRCVYERMQAGAWAVGKGGALLQPVAAPLAA